MIEENRKKIKEAADYIREKSSIKPEFGLILGSGLGELAEEIDNRTVIPYQEIPHFPVSTAPSHAGQLAIGELAGKKVLAMQGRFHLYEGYDPQEITLPIRVMKELGIDNLLVTCASGGLNRHYDAGDLMLISDHLNFTGANPLTGPNDPGLGERFPVMFDAYNPGFRALAKKVALEQKIPLKEGVYIGVAGPVFLTRAELRQAIQIGADAVGMSVIHEVIVARHSNMNVLGIAMITDMALPDVESHSEEKEILETANRTGPVFRKLIKGILTEIKA